MSAEDDMADDVVMNASMAEINLSSASLDITRTEIFAVDEEHDATANISKTNMELELDAVEEEKEDVCDSISRHSSSGSHRSSSGSGKEEPINTAIEYHKSDDANAANDDDDEEMN